MALIVQKYGGTSVATPEKIMNVARRVVRAKRRGNKIVVVVSALGHTTDDLITLAYRVTDSPSEREIDVLISTGEQVSVALLAMAIHDLKQPAISFTGPQVGIITDSSHTRARILQINKKVVEKQLRLGNVVIVAGFQGIDANFNITTLGRGGSDLTAVALAAVLKADRCEIYTDVEGIYTADPRIVPEARKLTVISYDEMLEMAGLGAQVLQPRSVEFAKKFSVPLYVRSSFSNNPGTLITKEVEAMEDIVVNGVALNKNESKVTVLGVPDKPGVAAQIFRAIAADNINIDMIVQNVSETGFSDVSFTVLKDDLKRTLVVAKQIVKKLGARGISSDENIAKVSVVGVGMRSHTGIAARMFEALARSKINIEMISTSEIKVSCVISRKSADKAMRAIHDEFRLGKRQKKKT